jgi:hypothetical protein
MNLKRIFHLPRPSQAGAIAENKPLCMYDSIGIGGARLLIGV